MSGPSLLRFAVEAVFLVAVALALVAADVELLPFVIVMGVAWILVASAEAAPIHRAREAIPEARRPEKPNDVESPPVDRMPQADPLAEAQKEPPRALEAVPTPEPEPKLEPRREDRAEPVVELPETAHRGPDGWNLWDLERRARARAGEDRLRDEEWSALIVSLRVFASPDGSLPTEFDQLVEESFGELISRRA